MTSSADTRHLRQHNLMPPTTRFNGRFRASPGRRGQKSPGRKDGFDGQCDCTVCQESGANWEVVARSLSAYERVMTTDQQAGKAWSEKLDKLINTLGTTEVAKPRPGTVEIAKPVQNKP
ncbi:hypothetical protein Q9L58_005627 [Maublancomyces gigas]|uniref:Uncharacterized protein n=1 Tax=Discina gigas TaxID=1032678 RepID=A0ABR3GHK9_9PEZI